jgi:hypothetical protein
MGTDIYGLAQGDPIKQHPLWQYSFFVGCSWYFKNVNQIHYLLPQNYVQQKTS